MTKQALNASGNQVPRDSEGYDGQELIRIIAGKGTYHFIKVKGHWYAKLMRAAADATDESDHAGSYTISVDAITVTDMSSIDHGSIGGLGDDDHSQYHNDTRGDARYHTQVVLGSNSNSQGASLIGIEDAGGLITATEVEGALAENRTAIDAIEDNTITSPLGTLTHAGTVGGDDQEIEVVYSPVGDLTTVNANDSAAAGTVGKAARGDHQHGVATAVVISVDLGANAEGISTSLARADHQHQLDVSISPTWTASHTWTTGSTFQSFLEVDGYLDLGNAWKVTHPINIGINSDGQHYQSGKTDYEQNFSICSLQIDMGISDYDTNFGAWV